MAKLVLVVLLALCAVFASAKLSKVEKHTLKWLNAARKNPNKVIPRLEKMLDNFDKTNPLVYHPPGKKYSVLTVEGAPAVKEAIEALRAVKPMKKLKPAAGLTLAARLHARDQGDKGTFSHIGTDKTDPWQRIKKFGSFKVAAAENMGSGYHKGFDIVAQLLIDDGMKSRGHRKNILNPKFRRVGVAVRKHKKYKYICVQDFAAGFKSKKGMKSKV